MPSDFPVRCLALAALLMGGCAASSPGGADAVDALAGGLWANTDAIRYEEARGPGRLPTWVRPATTVRFRQVEVRDSLLVRTLIAESDGDLYAVQGWDRAVDRRPGDVWTGERASITQVSGEDAVHVRWAFADTVTTERHARWTPPINAADLVGRWVATATPPGADAPESIVVTFRADGTAIFGEPAEVETPYHVVGSYLVLAEALAMPPSVVSLGAREPADAREIALDGDRMTWQIPEAGPVVFHRQPD